MSFSTKVMTFETNGSPTLELNKHGYSLVYILLKYENSPEYFYHSYDASLVPKLRMPNKTAGSPAIEFTPSMVSYFPCCMVISMTEDLKASIKIGSDMPIELDAYGIDGQKYTCSKPNGLTIIAPILSI